MTEKKHALLLFSKPPVPGMVKTRLTTKHGGFLSEVQAAEFFKRSLYDVSELAMHALLELQAENDALVAADPDAVKITYDFFVSTTPCLLYTSVAAFSVNGYNQLDDSVYYWCASGFGRAGRQGGRGSTDRGRAGPGGALRNHTRGRAVRGSKAEAKLPAGGVAPRPPPGARRRTARMLRRAGRARRRPDGLVPVSYTHLDVYKRQDMARLGFFVVGGKFMIKPTRGYAKTKPTKLG